MTDRIGRNTLCRCGSGKKYKNCCMNSVPPHKSEPTISGRFRFDPGSYGDVGAFMPSIACLQQMQPDEWEYYYVLVKPQRMHAQESVAVAEAENDLQAAFRQRQQTGSDFTVAENLRAKGYLKVDDFKIVAAGINSKKR
jgi:hypothetical protein